MSGAGPQMRRETTGRVARPPCSRVARRPRPRAKPGPRARSPAMTWLTPTGEGVQRANNIEVSYFSVNGLSLFDSSIVARDISAKPRRQVARDRSGDALPDCATVELRDADDFCRRPGQKHFV